MATIGIMGEKAIAAPAAKPVAVVAVDAVIASAVRIPPAIAAAPIAAMHFNKKL
jgi:hypothetical protein